LGKQEATTILLQEEYILACDLRAYQVAKPVILTSPMRRFSCNIVSFGSGRVKVFGQARGSTACYYYILACDLCAYQVAQAVLCAPDETLLVGQGDGGATAAEQRVLKQHRAIVAVVERLKTKEGDGEYVHTHTHAHTHAHISGGGSGRGYFEAASSGRGRGRETENEGGRR